MAQADTKDMKVLNERAAEGRRKAAARKAQAAGKGTPKTQQHVMGRTENLRRFIKIEPGARFELERVLTFNGNKLEESGEVIHVRQLVGSKGVEIGIIGKDRGHILTIGALYKALLPAA